MEGTPGDDVRDTSLSPSESSALNSSYLVPNLIPDVSPSSSAPEDASESDDFTRIALAEDFNKLSITTFEDKFFGQSR
jgi:hypothetical protein